MKHPVFSRATDFLEKHSFGKILRHSGNYLVSSLAVRAVGFISLPVMTRLLSPEDYGVINVFNSWQGVLVAIVTLNTYSALGRYYWERESDVGRFLGTSFIFVSILIGCFTVGTFYFGQSLATLLGLPVATLPFLGPLIFFYVLNSWFEQIMVPLRESRRIAIRNVLNTYLSFIISVAFILALTTDKFMGVVYASVAMGGAFAVYYSFVLRQYFKWAFDLTSVKYMLSFSVPLLPYALSGVILAQFDRVMVNHYKGPADAGLYSFAYNIGMLITLVLGALQTAWTPDFFKAMEEADFERVQKDSRKIMEVTAFAGIILVFFGEDIGRILGKNTFHGGLAIIPVVVISYLVYCIFTFYAWIFQFYKKNILLSLAVMISGVVNILLNAFFLPDYGYTAAAYTTWAAYGMLVLIMWFFTKIFLKEFAIPLWLLSRPIVHLMLMVGVYYLFYLAVNDTVASYAIKIALLLVFGVHLLYPYKGAIRTPAH